MRSLVIAVALALAACSQEAPAPVAEAPAETAAPESAVNAYAAALAGAAAEGQWFSRADEGVSAACFGPPQSECLVSIQCEAPSGKITIVRNHALAPDQATTLRVVTGVQTLDLAAQSLNQGLPMVRAEIADGAPEKAPLIGMLGAPQDRFAVEIGGDIAVYPWDDAVARVLTACA